MVLQTLHMLASDPKLRAVAMRLMTDLWRKQVRDDDHPVFPRLILVCLLLLTSDFIPPPSGSDLPGAAAPAGPAGQQGGGGEGRPVGAHPGQSRLPQGHLQREVRGGAWWGMVLPFEGRHQSLMLFLWSFKLHRFI